MVSARTNNKKVKQIQDSDSETSDEDYSTECSSTTETIGSDDSDTEEDETTEEEDETTEEEDETTDNVRTRPKSKRTNGNNGIEEEDETDPVLIRKEIANMFPSRYMNGKVKRDKDNKQKTLNKMSSKSKNKKNKKGRDVEYSSESDAITETFTLSLLDLLGSKMVDDDEYDEALIEDENETCDSDDEKVFMKESYEVVEDIDIKSEEKNVKVQQTTKKKKKKKSREDQDDNVEISNKFRDEYIELHEEKKYRIDRLKKNPCSKAHRRALRKCNKEINNLIKKARGLNTKGYHKLISSQNQHISGELEYFKKKLSNDEQLKIMKDMKEINDHILVDKPHRLALLQSDMPIKYKANVMQKVNMLKSMEPGDPEYYKVKSWVDDFMQVPFGKYSGLDVNMTHGRDKCNKFMEDAMKILDDCAYGLTEAKMQILQLVGQWISNPQAMGTAIAIKGPMGTGKTTLVKDGISKILQRYFAFIPLGGCGDGSFLEGHSYTYEGSGHGKIVQVLKESKSMNPVFYFDELDKVSESARGEEIIGILTHLTDTSQNNQFHDKYFVDVDFDLSKSLFIFSYNDESRVNPILKDRMYCIETKGYTTQEKLVIARNYLLPKIREQVNFKKEDIHIPDETIEYIITNNNLTKKEDGVRNLKRCLEVIHTKINLFRLVKMDEDNMFSKEINMKIEFPYTVTNADVDKLIKSEPPQNQSVLNSMYI
jgi:ATP-dependent Lon protease